jgi:hypothetical protein
MDKYKKMDTNSEDSKQTITAYNHIFEQKFTKLIKDIKKYRKDPSKKDHIKNCLHEAKSLRKTIRDAKKENKLYQITIKHDIISDTYTCTDSSLNINIKQIQQMNDVVAITFAFK